MHKSKSPNSNFRYFFFFFFLILVVCFLFRENENSTSASMTQSNGFISARSSSFLSFFFFRFPLPPFFSSFPNSSRHIPGKWVRRRRRVHWSIWERIELNEFILTNPIRQQYPVELASSPPPPEDVTDGIKSNEKGERQNSSRQKKCCRISFLNNNQRQLFFLSWTCSALTNFNKLSLAVAHPRLTVQQQQQQLRYFAFLFVNLTSINTPFPGKLN